VILTGAACKVSEIFMVAAAQSNYSANHGTINKQKLSLIYKNYFIYKDNKTINGSQIKSIQIVDFKY